MKKKNLMFGLALMATAISLSSCGGDGNNEPTPTMKDNPLDNVLIEGNNNYHVDQENRIITVKLDSYQESFNLGRIKIEGAIIRAKNENGNLTEGEIKINEGKNEFKIQIVFGELVEEYKLAIEVPKLALVSVNVIDFKASYRIGDEYVPCRADVSYADGSVKNIEITKDMLEGFDTSTKGKKLVTISYEDIKQDMVIIVEDYLVDIEVKDYKKEYLVGESYSPIRIEKIYKSGEREEAYINESDVLNFKSDKEAEYTLNASVDGFDISVDIVVKRSIPTLEIIEYEKNYLVGDSFKSALLRATYLSGASSSFVVEEDMLDGFDTSTPGTKTVTVNYDGAKISLEIVVEEEKVSFIDAKTSYGVGDKFVAAGQLKLEAFGEVSYVDLDYNSLKEFDTSVAGPSVIVFEHNGKEYKLEIMVYEKILELVELEDFYIVNENFKGGKLKLTVGDECTYIDITFNMVDGFSTTGPEKNKEITISYDNLSVKGYINVYERNVTLNRFNYMYYQNQDFIPGLLKVEIDNKIEYVEITRDMVKGFDTTKFGYCPISIEYKDVKISEAIKVMSDEEIYKELSLNIMTSLYAYNEVSVRPDTDYNAAYLSMCASLRNSYAHKADDYAKMFKDMNISVDELQDMLAIARYDLRDVMFFMDNAIKETADMPLSSRIPNILRRLAGNVGENKINSLKLLLNRVLEKLPLEKLILNDKEIASEVEDELIFFDKTLSSFAGMTLKAAINMINNNKLKAYMESIAEFNNINYLTRDVKLGLINDMKAIMMAIVNASNDDLINIFNLAGLNLDINCEGFVPCFKSLSKLMDSVLAESNDLGGLEAYLIASIRSQRSSSLDEYDLNNSITNLASASIDYLKLIINSLNNVTSDDVEAIAILLNNDINRLDDFNVLLYTTSLLRIANLFSDVIDAINSDADIISSLSRLLGIRVANLSNKLIELRATDLENLTSSEAKSIIASIKNEAKLPYLNAKIDAKDLYVNLGSSIDDFVELFNKNVNITYMENGSEATFTLAKDMLHDLDLNTLGLHKVSLEVNGGLVEFNYYITDNENLYSDNINKIFNDKLFYFDSKTNEILAIKDSKAQEAFDFNELVLSGSYYKLFDEINTIYNTSISSISYELIMNENNNSINLGTLKIITDKGVIYLPINYTMVNQEAVSVDSYNIRGREDNIIEENNQFGVIDISINNGYMTFNINLSETEFDPAKLGLQSVMVNVLNTKLSLDIKVISHKEASKIIGGSLGALHPNNMENFFISDRSLTLNTFIGNNVYASAGKVFEILLEQYKDSYTNLSIESTSEVTKENVSFALAILSNGEKIDEIRLVGRRESDNDYNHISSLDEKYIILADDKYNELKNDKDLLIPFFIENYKDSFRADAYSSRYGSAKNVLLFKYLDEKGQEYTFNIANYDDELVISVESTKTGYLICNIKFVSDSDNKSELNLSSVTPYFTEYLYGERVEFDSNNLPVFTEDNIIDIIDNSLEFIFSYKYEKNITLEETQLIEILRGWIQEGVLTYSGVFNNDYYSMTFKIGDMERVVEVLLQQHISYEARPYYVDDIAKLDSITGAEISSILEYLDFKINGKNEENASFVESRGKIILVGREDTPTEIKLKLSLNGVEFIWTLNKLADIDLANLKIENPYNGRVPAIESTSKISLENVLANLRISYNEVIVLYFDARRFTEAGYEIEYIVHENVHTIQVLLTKKELKEFYTFTFKYYNIEEGGRYDVGLFGGFGTIMMKEDNVYLYNDKDITDVEVLLKKRLTGISIYDYLLGQWTKYEKDNLADAYKTYEFEFIKEPSNKYKLNIKKDGVLIQAKNLFLIDDVNEVIYIDWFKTFNSHADNSYDSIIDSIEGVYAYTLTAQVFISDKAELRRLIPSFDKIYEYSDTYMAEFTFNGVIYRLQVMKNQSYRSFTIYHKPSYSGRSYLKYNELIDSISKIKAGNEIISTKEFLEYHNIYIADPFNNMYRCEESYSRGSFEAIAYLSFE